MEKIIEDIIFKANIKEVVVKIYIFRHLLSRTGKFSLPRFNTHIKAITNNTIYRKPSKIEDAPKYTDCLTLIHYLFKQSINVDIPLTWIGNMPRSLMSSNHWDFLHVDSSRLLYGDIIFVKDKNKSKLLSHVAFSLGKGHVFHCSPELKTARAEPIKDFFKSYEQRLNSNQVLLYIDPRDKIIRKKYNGAYIKS